MPGWDEMLRVSDVAKMLKCPVSTVYSLLARRDLESMRLGPKGSHRIPMKSLEAMRERTTTPVRKRV